VHGDVELIILWRYNPSLDWDPFDRGNVSDGPVNELRIAAFRGRKLAIRDKNLFSAGGSSDPKLTFALTTAGKVSEKFKTKAIKTTLDPVWKEQFCFPLKPDDCGGTCVLEVKCEDADTISSNDAMGSVSIDLMPLQGKTEQKWYELTGEGAEGAIELIIQWRHDPTRHEAELDAKARKEAKAAEDAKRKAQEAEREAAEQQRLADEAERKRKALEEAEARRKAKDEADALRQAEEDARLKTLAERRTRNAWRTRLAGRRSSNASERNVPRPRPSERKRNSSANIRRNSRTPKTHESSRSRKPSTTRPPRDGGKRRASVGRNWKSWLGYASPRKTLAETPLVKRAPRLMRNDKRPLQLLMLLFKKLMNITQR
jgi:hypothetical protein